YNGGVGLVRGRGGRLLRGTGLWRGRTGLNCGLGSLGLVSTDFGDEAPDLLEGLLGRERDTALGPRYGRHRCVTSPKKSRLLHHICNNRPVNGLDRQPVGFLE